MKIQIFNNRLQKHIVTLITSFNLAFMPAIANKVKEGNKLYQKENYDEALKKYTDAQIDMPESPEISFNIADILYKQRKYGESEQILQKAIPQSDTALLAKIYYNIGNCKYRQGDLRGSLDLYKKALELNPKDEDAKYNIEFVERKIKEMMSQSKQRIEKQKQQQQNKKEEQQKQEEQKEQKDEQQQKEQQTEKIAQEQQKENTQNETESKNVQQKQEQKQKEQQEKQKQQKQKEAQQQKEEQQQKKEAMTHKETKVAEAEEMDQPKELTKEEAETLLRMMSDEEQNTKKTEEEKNKKTRYPGVEKPW